MHHFFSYSLLIPRNSKNLVHVRPMADRRVPEGDYVRHRIRCRENERMEAGVVRSVSCIMDLRKHFAYDIGQFRRCRIGIPHEDIESNDAVIFGFMVAIFLKHFIDSISDYQPLVVAHFHEWQAGSSSFFCSRAVCVKIIGG